MRIRSLTQEKIFSNQEYYRLVYELWKEGMVPHIQIHDELDFSIFNKEQSEMVIDKMVNCVDMRVPLVVDYESGDNWGEAV